MFIMGQLLKYLEPILQETAKVASWQVHDFACTGTEINRVVRIGFILMSGNLLALSEGR